MKEVRTTCKYYNEDECILHGEFICKKKNCSEFLSKYARLNCKHFKSNESRPSYRCSILCGTGAGAPCEHPRIKRNGRPVRCTFYECKSDN